MSRRRFQALQIRHLHLVLNHDGTPSWKYAEFKQIAVEFSKLQRLGFPRYRKPDVAIAYSFESNIASRPPDPSNTVRNYFTVGHTDQVESALQPFFEDNIDVAIVNIGHSALDYKLLVVPADYMMDSASADAVRNYIRKGGTVVMIAMSAKVDENNQWFDTPQPGRLSDVFGIRTEEFYRPGTPPEFSLNGKTEKASIGSPKCLSQRRPSLWLCLRILPRNRQPSRSMTTGKGVPSMSPFLRRWRSLPRLVRSLCADLNIGKGPETPSGP